MYCMKGGLHGFKVHGCGLSDPPKSLVLFKGLGSVLSDLLHRYYTGSGIVFKALGCVLSALLHRYYTDLGFIF